MLVLKVTEKALKPIWRSSGRMFFHIPSEQFTLLIIAYFEYDE